MNRFSLSLALLLAVVGVQTAMGQYTVYYPETAVTSVPATTYYAPTPVTTYYAPAPAPIATYYAPTPAPVTTYYAPTPAPVASYYSPAPVVVAPTAYVTRYRPLLGGSVTTAYYGYAPPPRMYYWRY